MPDAAPQSSLPPRSRTAWIPLVLAAAVAAAHGAGVRNGFVWDDETIIVENPDTRDISRIGSVMLSPDVRAPYYRPLNRASYLVDYQVFGMNAAGFHLVNILLQIGCTIALYALARSLALGRAGAIAAALLLAVHPIGVEVVAFVSARNNLFALLFSLLSLLALVRAERLASLGLAVVSGTCFFLGLASKEPAVMVLPASLALVLLPGLRSRPPAWRSMLLVAPQAVALLAYTALRALSLGQLLGASRGQGALSGGLLDRLWLNFFTVPRYLWLLVFPRDLTIFQQLPEPNTVTLLLSAVAWMALIGLIVPQLRRRSPAATLGVIWFFLGLLPISNLFALPTTTVLAERYFFIPAVGIWLVLGAGIDELWRAQRARPAVLVVGAAVLLAFTARSAVRTLDWRDPLSLNRAAVRVTPGAAIARSNLGNALKESGDVPGAWREWREAARLDPMDPGPPLNMGVQASAEGNTEQAELYLRRSTQLAPGFSPAHVGLAQVYKSRGDYLNARRQLELALVTEPRNAMALASMGDAWMKSGDPVQGEQFFRAALDVDPRSSEAHFGLGEILEARGQTVEARRHWLASLASSPRSTTVLVQLGVSLASGGDVAEGERYLRRALEVDPTLPEALFNLGKVCELTGRPGEAVAHYRKFLKSPNADAGARVIAAQRIGVLDSGPR